MDNGEDRLTVLPDDIHIILQKLERKDILRTYVTAKKFTDLLVRELNLSKNIELVCGSRTNVADFTMIVRRTIKLIEDTHTFTRLRYEAIDGLTPAAGNSNRPTGRAVAMRIKLHNLLPSFSRLSVLEVVSCLIGGWTANLNQLVKLNLTNCAIVDDDCKDMISRTPRLEELKIESCMQLNSITVISSTLRRLTLVGNRV